MQVLRFLRQRSQFDESDKSLRNIDTGVTADKCVDVASALDIGEKVIQNMVGKSIDEYVFRKKDRSVTLSDNNA